MEKSQQRGQMSSKSGCSGNHLPDYRKPKSSLALAQVKRVAATVTFAISGMLSVWFAAAWDAQICNHFPRLCVARGCTEIGVCSIGSWRGALFFSLFFGPSLFFGFAAAVFSTSRRTWSGWLLLLTVLVSCHWTVVLAMRLT